MKEKTTGVVMLPIGQLHPHPDNPRKDLGDLTELEKALSELEQSIVAQYYRPEEVKKFCQKLKEEILALNPYISGVTSDCLHAGKVLETAYLSR